MSALTEPMDAAYLAEPNQSACPKSRSTRQTSCLDSRAGLVQVLEALLVIRAVVQLLESLLIAAGWN